MRRVVITGIGIVSPIGNNATEVEASLRAGKSGIEQIDEERQERGGFHDRVHSTHVRPAVESVGRWGRVVPPLHGMG